MVLWIQWLLAVGRGQYQLRRCILRTQWSSMLSGKRLGPPAVNCPKDDIYLAEKRLEAVRSGRSRAVPLEEVMRRLSGENLAPQGAMGLSGKLSLLRTDGLELSFDVRRYRDPNPSAGRTEFLVCTGRPVHLTLETVCG
jgi:hypothetical protein